jgi:hypothetical protein
MSDQLTMSIDLRAFEKDMTTLGGEIADKVALQAIRAGGEVFLEALRERVPEREDLPSGTALAVGEMESDLQLRTSRQADGTVIARVGPGAKTRHVAVWVEYGHEQHGSEKRFIGGRLEGKFVKAHPWIRVAFDMAQDDAAAVVGFVMQTEIAKEAAQLGYV